MCEAVRPARPHGHDVAWEALAVHEAAIRVWVTAGLRLTKIADLLARRGVRVPYRSDATGPAEGPSGLLAD